MKKPLIIFLILVFLIVLGYVGEWAVSQPIASSYDPTAIHWASTHAAGDTLYNDASTNDSRSWKVLNKGTAYQAYLMNAGATAPAWTTLTLTTHTSGNYVKSITNGAGITGGDGGSEGAALTIAATLGTDISAAEIANGDHGDFTYSGGTATLDADVVGGNEIADADYGDFTFSSGSATLDTGVVADNEIDYSNVTLADFDYQGNWKTFYTDGSGDVQELANGTNTWVLTSQGTGTAPHWAVTGGVEDDAYGAGWNGDTANAPSQNAVYDYLVQFDADADGSFTDESWLTGWTGSASITTLGTITTGNWGVANGIELATDTTGNYVATLADAGNSALTIANSGSENAAVTIDIAANGIEMATDTTGNYVATIADAGNSAITVANSGSEAAAVTLDITAGGIEMGTDTSASNYKTFYSDGSGDVQELSLGTNTWVLTSQGTGTAPAWATAPGAAGGDAWSDPVDSDLIPDTDDTYDVGSSTMQFKDGYFDGTLEADVMTVGGVAVLTSVEMGTDTTASNWSTFYSDGSGDVQELANGTNTWVLTSQGTGTAPHWAVSSGVTAWDDIGDPDSAATVDFKTHTQTIDIGKSDSGGGSGLILDVTGLGAGTDDVIALTIKTATDGDADYVPFKVLDNTNDLKVNINQTGKIYAYGGFETRGDVDIGGSTSNQLDIVGLDAFYIYLGGDDVDLKWNDGVLNLRNTENGVDAIVEIEGYGADEKGRLRVLSEGDDKWIELYNDDTDGIILASPTGVIKTASLTVTNVFNVASATVTMPKRTSNDDKFYSFNAWNPNALYDTDTQLGFEPNLPAAITITEVTVTLDADPTTELDWNLKWADAFIGLGNATLIVAIDTTSGTTDVDSGFNDATVAAGKCLYIEFDADPDSNIKQAIVKIRYDYD